MSIISIPCSVSIQAFPFRMKITSFKIIAYKHHFFIIIIINIDE